MNNFNLKDHQLNAANPVAHAIEILALLCVLGKAPYFRDYDHHT
jgi:hypothetical protein